MQKALRVCKSPSTATFTVEGTSGDESKRALKLVDRRPQDSRVKSKSDILMKRFRCPGGCDTGSMKRKKTEDPRSEFRMESGMKDERNCENGDDAPIMSRSFTLPNGKGYLDSMMRQGQLTRPESEKPIGGQLEPTGPVSKAQASKLQQKCKNKNVQSSGFHGKRKKSMEMPQFMKIFTNQKNSPSSLTRTASSIQIDEGEGLGEFNLEKSSVLSTSTYVVGIESPGPEMSTERGKNESGVERPGGSCNHQLESSVGLLHNLLVKYIDECEAEQNRLSRVTVKKVLDKIRDEKSPKRKKRGNVCLKIYKRRRPRSLSGRHKFSHAESEMSLDESDSGKAPSESDKELRRRNSEPSTKKSFVWRKENRLHKDGINSVVSNNSSLAHMNWDEVEEFSFWERVTSAGPTSSWEVNLCKRKRSWSLLSLAAFRYNRISHIHGEILQILRNGDVFYQRKTSSPQQKLAEGRRERLVLPSALDVEPSIFQKNIDIRNWLDAFRSHGRETSDHLQEMEGGCVPDYPLKTDSEEEKPSKSRLDPFQRFVKSEGAGSDVSKKMQKVDRLIQGIMNVGEGPSSSLPTTPLEDASSTFVNIICTLVFALNFMISTLQSITTLQMRRFFQ